MAPPIEVNALTKRYSGRAVVDDLSFEVAAGRVTGFLGPNGAGKTTTLRCLLGLVAPSSGEALVNGHRYSALKDPINRVGAALEVSAFHPGRSGRSHLLSLAAAGGVGTAKVDELLELVELTPAAQQRVGGYSLGMRQRLSLAACLLGEPEVLVLDEPANGLDPQGVRWLRDVLRGQADQGRTVLVSSHLLAEVQQTVDDLVVIRQGKMVFQGSLADAVAGGGGTRVWVVSPAADRLAAALSEDGLRSEAGPVAGSLRVHDATPEQVGDRAATAGIALHALYAERDSLEDRFIELTAERGAQ